MKTKDNTYSRMTLFSGRWSAVLAFAAIVTIGFMISLVPRTSAQKQDTARSDGGRSKPATRMLPDSIFTATFTEGFEGTFPPTTPGLWSIRNASVAGGTNPQCWNAFTTTPWAPHTGAGHAGANFNCTTGANTISGWFIGPLITFHNGDTISFWTRAGGTFADRLQLRLALDSTDPVPTTPFTTPEDVGTYTTILQDVNPSLLPTGYPTTFTQFTGTISGLGAPTVGRFAFRYYVTNGGPDGANSNIISIDDVVYTNATGGASVTGTKAVSGTFTVGQTVTYTVTLTNGGGAQADNPGNEFTDVLPADLSLVSASATSGTVTTASNTVNWNGGLAAAGSVTITITATINAGTTGHTVSNQGTILYDADGNGTNETTALTDNPGTPAANDPTSFTVIPAGCTPFAVSNVAPITINDNAAATPYPSNIVVSGVPGRATKVTVSLTGLSHTFPSDIDLLLVGPGGQKAVIMSDVGGSTGVTGVNLTLDDTAAASMTTGALTTGTFKPTNLVGTLGVEPDAWPAPAPAPPAGGASALSVFNGLFTNGTWSLYVFDDTSGDFGSFSGGWGMTLTTDCSTAAGVSVGGRILTSDGRGLRNARVTMTDSHGVVRVATTGALGHYQFDDVETGETYQIRVFSKRYFFSTKVVPVSDTLTDVDFVAGQ